MNGLPANNADLSKLLHQAAWLRRLAVRLLRDNDEADDVVQATLIAAWTDPPSTERDVRPWLAAVARNRVHDGRRTEQRRRNREEVVADERARAERAMPATPERLLGDLQIHRAVAEAVATLDEPFRETAVLHFYDGLTAADVARRLDVPAGTIRWRIKEAIDRLRHTLDRKHGGDREVWRRALLPLLPLDGFAKSPTFSSAISYGTAAVALVSVLAAILVVVRHNEKASDRPAGGDRPSRALSTAVVHQVRPPVTTTMPGPLPQFVTLSSAEVDTEAGRALHEAEGTLKNMLRAIVEENYEAFAEKAHDLFKARFTPEIMKDLIKTLAPRLSSGYEMIPFGTLEKQVTNLRFTVYLWKLEFRDRGDDVLIQLGLSDGAVVGFFTK